MDTAPSFIFDLDGTLIDSVYQHVLAWREAFERIDVDLPVWRIHRLIGISGGLMLQALSRNVGRSFGESEIQQLQDYHCEAYARFVASVRPLPGAVDLTIALTHADIPWAIATSSDKANAMSSIARLNLPREPKIIVTRDDVAQAKPNPDLFLAAASRLGTNIGSAFVVGDSTWDLLAAKRAHALGIGLLCGGYGQAELESAHAFRVYADPAELLSKLEELGIRDVS